MSLSRPLLPVADPVELFKALSDPVRLDLFTRIVGASEMSCTKLVEEAEVGASTVSYHVKTLKAAGLVAVRKAGRNYHYTARPDAIATLRELFDDLSALCRQNAATRTDRSQRSA